MKKIFIEAAKLMSNPVPNVDGCCVAINRVSGYSYEASRVFAGIFEDDAYEETGRTMYWMGEPSMPWRKTKNPIRQRRVWALLLASEVYQDFLEQ